MKVFARDKVLHDIFLDSTGQIAMVESKNCHAQIIEAVILTLLGELQLNTERGIPYLETIFESRMYLEQWRSAIKRSINKFDWVRLIEEFNTEFKGSTLLYSMTIITEDGERIVIDDSIDSSITVPTYSGGDDMANLVDANGNFYLPDTKENGVQLYRKLTVYSDMYGKSTVVSDEVYIKDANGNFVVKS